MISIQEHIDHHSITKLQNWYLEEILNPSNGRINILERLFTARNEYINDDDKLAIIDFIITNFDHIIIACPSEQEDLIEDFLNLELPSGSAPDKVLLEPINAKVKFKDEIIKILGYTNFRDNDFSKEFALKLDIKTCPYCMAQFTSIRSNELKKSKMKLYFELDHFYPKDPYPFLSRSLYNLIPVCGSCNKTKSKLETCIELDFHPWMKHDLSKNFSYKMSNYDIAEIYINGKHKFDFEIEYRNNLSLKEEEKLSFHLFKYSVLGQVHRHSDLAEELAWKKYIYLEHYKRNMIKTTFKDLFDNELDLERFIVGNYTDPKDHLKRPLAKFQTDIARQLKLIK